MDNELPFPIPLPKPDRVQVTDTGTVIEYRRNAHGGTDVRVIVPALGIGGVAAPLAPPPPGDEEPPA